MSKINFYTIFHLNLAFSSIPESELPAVIRRCYWPLLRLVKKFKGAIAIETTGYTLEKILELDPKWIGELRGLLKSGATEFIGSGYAQIIGPLVPAEVNAKNLSIGNDVYRDILGVRLNIAFVNEQAFSRGLINGYSGAGYEAIMMEWNNPRQWHPEWKNELRYTPQSVTDGGGNVIRVIWNDSIAFQKFERCVRGSIEDVEYFDYLRSHCGAEIRYMSLYTSDAEVFDYRPGRYKAEAYYSSGEWGQVEKIFKKILAEEEMSCILPSKLLSLPRGDVLKLESTARPIIVKKQDKYNVVRWALTGRDDIGSNTACYRIFSKLKFVSGASDSLWKKLCYLWDSDFRTHTDEEKHKKFKKELVVLERKVDGLMTRIHSGLPKGERVKKINLSKVSSTVVVDTPAMLVKLNEKRGLTFDEVIFKNISDKPLIKVLPHGYYENISFGVDFYSGHTIIEAPLTPKVTDLLPAVGKGVEGSGFTRVTSEIPLDIGKEKKNIMVYKKENRLDLACNFFFKKNIKSSFRTGIITLNPEAFDSKTLYFSCHNGGGEAEKFYLADVDLIDIRPLSLLITAQNVLGNTTGCLEIGDKDKAIVLRNDMSMLAALPMMHFQRVGDTYFLRVLYSLGEIDETSLLGGDSSRPVEYSFNLSIEAKNNESK